MTPGLWTQIVRGDINKQNKTKHNSGAVTYVLICSCLTCRCAVHQPNRSTYFLNTPSRWSSKSCLLMLPKFLIFFYCIPLNCWFSLLIFPTLPLCISYMNVPSYSLNGNFFRIRYLDFLWVFIVFFQKETPLASQSEPSSPCYYRPGSLFIFF